MKKKLPFSLVLTAVLALFACTAYALTQSDLLSLLFPGGSVRDDAYQYLQQTPVSVQDGGLTLTVSETLFDGRRVSVIASIRNDTTETLYIAATPLTLNDVAPDSCGGYRLFNFGVEYLAIGPGETLSGDTYSDFLPEVFEAADSFTASMEVYALRATAEIPASEDGVYYPSSAFTADNSEQAAHLSLSYRVDGSMIHTATYTVPRLQSYRMDGCTLLIKEANFTPSSTFISFDVLADDPAEGSVGRLDSSTDGRLIRWYAIFDNQGNRLDDIAAGGGAYTASDDGLIEYVYDYAPLAEIPTSITIAPIESNEPVMGKAVVVEIKTVR